METQTKVKVETKTDIKVVLIDETDGWADEIKAKVNKISTAYLYDKSEKTYCAEITPSFYLIPLYYVVDFGDFERDEELEEEIHNEFHNEQPIYMHCYSIEKYEHANEQSTSCLNIEIESHESEKYNKFMDSLEENFKCNHPI